MGNKKKYKVISCGWYGQVGNRHGAGVQARDFVVIHRYGDVVDIEGILFFVWKNPKQKYWSIAHFLTGLDIGTDKLFSTKNGAIEAVQDALDDIVHICRLDITRKRVFFFLEREEKNEIKESVRRFFGDEGIGYPVNYVNPHEEPREGLYSLLKSNTN